MNQDSDRWCAGPVICDYCGKKWVAACPENAERLECPQCHTHNGTFTGELVGMK